MERFVCEGVILETQPESRSRGVVAGTFVVVEEVIREEETSTYVVRWVPEVAPRMSYRVEFFASSISSIKREQNRITFVLNTGETLGPYVFPARLDDLLDFLVDEHLIDKTTYQNPPPINLESVSGFALHNISRAMQSVFKDTVINSFGRRSPEFYESRMYPERAQRGETVVRKTENLGDLGDFEVVETGCLPPRQVCHRGEPVSLEQWEKLVATDENELRRLVFKGGVEAAIRQRAWLYFHDVDTSDSEQELHLRGRYADMMTQWKTMSEGQITRNKFLRENFSIIEKDVMRTDRVEKRFVEEGGPGLTAIDNILKSHCMYNFDLGYMQGMSDIVSVLFDVLEDEALTFWCFAHWMRTLAPNFAKGQPKLIKQLGNIIVLIRFVDPELMAYLEEQDSDHCMFCFRWLLVLFKREFHFEDVKLIWEALWTEYYSPDFSVFVAAAMLLSIRDDIILRQLKYDTILQTVNELSYTLTVKTVLQDAESIYKQVREVKDQLPSTLLPLLETWVERHKRGKARCFSASSSVVGGDWDDSNEQ